MRVIVAALAVVALSAATAGGALIVDADTEPSATSPRVAAWVPLDELPLAGADIDDASLAATSDGLFVSTVARSRSAGRPSRVSVYSRTSQGTWRLAGGRSFAVNRDERATLTGGERICLVAPIERQTAVRCLRQGRWRTQGSSAFRNSAPSSKISFAGVIPSAGPPLVMRAEQQRGGRTVGGPAPLARIEHRVLRFTGSRWASLAGSDLDAEAAGGTQRPTGIDLNGRPCVAYNRIPADLSNGPSILTRCASRDSWRSVASPLGYRDVDPTAQQPFAIGIDGAAAADGSIFIGVDSFLGRDVTWSIFRLAQSSWKRVTTPYRRPGWQSQGSLYTINEQPWAIQFDQRPSPGGLETQLTAFKVSDSPQKMGLPLASSSQFYGPLYYGLAENRDGIFAMASVPDHKARRNVVSVYQLRGAGA